MDALITKQIDELSIQSKEDLKEGHLSVSKLILVLEEIKDNHDLILNIINYLDTYTIYNCICTSKENSLSVIAKSNNELWIERLITELNWTPIVKGNNFSYFKLYKEIQEEALMLDNDICGGH